MKEEGGCEVGGRGVCKRRKEGVRWEGGECERGGRRV